MIANYLAHSHERIHILLSEAHQQPGIL